MSCMHIFLVYLTKSIQKYLIWWILWISNHDRSGNPATIPRLQSCWYGTPHHHIYYKFTTTCLLLHNVLFTRDEGALALTTRITYSWLPLYYYYYFYILLLGSWLSQFPSHRGGLIQLSQKSNIIGRYQP